MKSAIALRIAGAITAVSILLFCASVEEVVASQAQSTEFSSVTRYRARAVAAPVRRSTVSRAPVARRGGFNRVSRSPSVVRRPVISRSQVNVNRAARINRSTVINNRNINRANLRPSIGRSAIAPGPARISPTIARPTNVSAVRLTGGRISTAWRAGFTRRIWWGGGWRAFLPITALGAVVIGGAYYYPDAYLAVARPYCEGLSPDGCRLNWQLVGFEGGDGEWQCVQYCPRPGAPPPPRTVALVAPPPAAAAGQCEISIFSEPDFRGSVATVNTEQANLAQSGWQNEIASIKVVSGTWDIFSDVEFVGDTMRLARGEYARLSPEWNKRSGSFMCVQNYTQP